MRFLENHDKPALLAGERSLTYTELLEAIARMGAVLNPAPESRVALYLENCPEWVFAFYAVWQCRAINVTIDHELPPDDVAFILNDCRPALLLCSRASEARARRALERAPIPCRLLVLEDLPPDAPLPPAPPAPIDGDPEKTAVIIYTSGTTGTPKGVMLSFRNLFVNIQAVAAAGIFTPEQRTLVMLPLHHILPLVGSVLAPLASAGSIVFTPSLSPTDIMAALQRHAVTIIIGVPRFYALITGNIQARIAASPAARMLFALARRSRSPALAKVLFGSVHRKFGGHLQFMVSGGAPLDPSVGECLRTLGFNVLEGYGMTEAAPMITFPRPDCVRPGSCGQALENNEVRIIDDEVVTRGPNLMQGYYNRPEETAEVLRDGWLYTGDTGYLDADGYLFITGRKKEIIVLPSGKKVNPAEIEEKLCALAPAVREAGVFMRNGTLQAVIRLDESISDAEPFLRDQLLAPYNAQAASYKQITRAWPVSADLPKTRLGKLRRFMLPELAAQHTDETPQNAAPPSPTCRRLIESLAPLVSAPVTPDARLAADLGLDSLGRINLQVYIQDSFGVSLDESDFAQLPTARRLAEFIDEKKLRDVEKPVHWKEILTASPDGVTLPHSSPIHRLLLCTLNALARHGFRFRATGAEHIPADGPFIFVANHASYLDGVFLSAALGTRHMQNVFFYAKESHVRGPFLRWLARNCNVIVMDINHHLRESIQKMSIALKSGHSIIIFPEGTRTRTGEMGPFRPTFAMLSRELAVPILPAAIQGAFSAFPAGHRLPRFLAPITVQILPPVVPDTGTYPELSETVREKISAALEENA